METTVRYPEPALIEHEIVHIAELIGEIRPGYSGDIRVQALKMPAQLFLYTQALSS